MGLSTTFTLKFDGDKVKKGLKGIGTSIKNLGNAALGIAKAGAAIVAFGVGAAIGIAAVALKLNSVGEAAKTSEARLKNIIDSMDLFGNKSKDVADRLNDLADAQGRMIGEDNKVIRLTQSKLMTFKELAMTANMVGGAFDRATMAALDMASAGFGTAEMNAVQLGKALNDPIKGINSLTRSGITFTDQEKAKIKTLVESNQTLKAQDMILKAIEKQVSGTAQATADGSKKMAESASQILQAFSKPFSDGFNSIPGMLENVFPKIKSKAEEMGKMFSMAISEAVTGDFVRFEAIGKLIGDVISAAAVAAFQAGSTSIVEGSVNYLKKNLVDPLGRNGEMSESEKYRGASFKELFDAQMTIREVGSQSQSLQQMGKRGIVPNAPEFVYAQPGEPATIMNGERVVRSLETIVRHVSPQP
jgi:hypothetical protein